MHALAVVVSIVALTVAAVCCVAAKNYADMAATSAALAHRRRLT